MSATGERACVMCKSVFVLKASNQICCSRECLKKRQYRCIYGVNEGRVDARKRMKAFDSMGVAELRARRAELGQQARLVDDLNVPTDLAGVVEWGRR